MVDKNLFLETLNEVSEIAKSSDQPLSREEVRRYFQDMELSEEQEEMVYRYFQLPQEERNAEPDPQDETADTSDTPVGQAEQTDGEEEAEEPVSIERLSDSTFYRMYLDEVKEHKVSEDAQMLELYRKLLDGDTAVQQEIVQNWLMRVIKIAALYKSSPVNMEDLIQEGNMGLWLALGETPAEAKAHEMEDYLAQKVRESMESYIREVTGDADWTQAVLAKAALLHEAQELLAKENGQAPSLRQISEYTHIPADEIQDILALYKEENK